MNASLEIRIHVRLMLVISREAGHSGSYLLGGGRSEAAAGVAVGRSSMRFRKSSSAAECGAISVSTHARVVVVEAINN